MVNIRVIKHCAKMLEIDGGVLEGGGQILRNAISYSAILKIPIRVYNIRAGRENPGLRPQHLTGLELVCNLCNGKLNNAFVGSTEITFEPGALRGGCFNFDTKTAGSVVLLMQVALPCALFSNETVSLTLRGGTNAEKAPQIDYFDRVFRTFLKEKLKIGFHCNLIRRGFYPKGGGLVEVIIDPVSFIEPLTLLERGKVLKVSGISFSAGVLPPKVSRLCSESATSYLLKNSLHNNLNKTNVNIEHRVENESTAFGNGNGIVIEAITDTGCVLGADCLGKRGLAAESVGETCAKSLCTTLEQCACVDEYLQDQLIIFMALAKGRSQIRTGPVTLHTETAIYVADLMTSAKFVIEKNEDGTNIIVCDGMSIENY